MANIDPTTARERLTHERTRVEGLIASIKDEMGDGSEQEAVGDLSGYDQHPADSGSDTFEREKDFSILESLESELVEIEAAMHRIDDGSYGVDEMTGEPIDPERLIAFPTARTNIATHERPVDPTHGSGATPI